MIVIFCQQNNFIMNYSVSCYKLNLFMTFIWVYYYKFKISHHIRYFYFYSVKQS